MIKPVSNINSFNKVDYDNKGHPKLSKKKKIDKLIDVRFSDILEEELSQRK